MTGPRKAGTSHHHVRNSSQDMGLGVLMVTIMDKHFESVKKNYCITEDRTYAPEDNFISLSSVVDSSEVR